MIVEFSRKSSFSSIDRIDFATFALTMDDLMSTSSNEPWGHVYDIIIGSNNKSTTASETMDAESLIKVLAVLGETITTEEAHEMIRACPNRDAFVRMFTDEPKSKLAETVSAQLTPSSGKLLSLIGNSLNGIKGEIP